MAMRWFRRNVRAVDEPMLRGARTTLRPFGPADIHARYLAWLGDPVVNAYSRRGDGSITAEQAAAYLSDLGADERVLAIETDALGHIGNVKYGPIDRANRRADISIMIGERRSWGLGYGGEAIHVVSRHLFEHEGLNRLDAGTANPAFLRMVARLGWRVEGVLRERVWLRGQPLDWTLVAQLRSEFQPIGEYQPVAAEDTQA
ncbi:MAG: GNAT family N-acetyltransferase [Alphaproteobacteria bacterium]